MATYIVRLVYTDKIEYVRQTQAESTGEALLKTSAKSPHRGPTSAEVLARTGPAAKPTWLPCWFDPQVLSLL